MKHLTRNKTGLLYAVALVGVAVSAILGILLGSANVSVFQGLSDLFAGNTGSAEARIFLYVRLPRVLGSLVCGMALAVSGAVIQNVLANRLASPGIIGVNAGAGLAVTLCSAVGILGGWEHSLFAFLGAFGAVMLISIGAKKWGASRGTVILMGVALNAFLGAISNTVTALIPQVSMLSNDFKLGDFSAVTYGKLLPAAAVILVSVTVSVTRANELDVLTLGEETAKGLGLNTGLARGLFLLLAALLAGSAVSLCGLLSFVGLLVPHCVRRMGVSQSRHLIPLCALFGAGFVTLCDTLARALFAPYELPVGILLAFLGAPFFVYILVKGKGGHRDA